MKNKITTLEDLEKEQEKLKIMMAITSQEFTKSLKNNQKELKGAFLKNIAIPTGAVGLGIAATKSMTSNNNNITKSSNSNIWKKLLPIGIKLLQAYLVKNQTEKLENIANQKSIHKGQNNTLKSLA